MDLYILAAIVSVVGGLSALLLNDIKRRLAFLEEKIGVIPTEGEFETFRDNMKEISESAATIAGLSATTDAVKTAAKEAKYLAEKAMGNNSRAKDDFNRFKDNLPERYIPRTEIEGTYQKKDG